MNQYKALHLKQPWCLEFQFLIQVPKDVDKSPSPLTLSACVLAGMTVSH